MAHPHVMDNAPAIAEAANIAQQTVGIEIVAVVIGGCDLHAMGRDDHIADFQHRAMACTADIAQLRPAVGPRGQRGVIARHEPGRRQRYEHAIDVARIDGLRAWVRR